MNDPERGNWTSASNSEADSRCAGRHLAQQQAPPQVESADASFGNAIHSALATNDASKLPLEQREIFEACQKLTVDCMAKVFAKGVGLTYFREKRLWAAWTPIIDGAPREIRHSGQTDFVCIGGDTALILDYKTLAGDVAESSTNLQLRDLCVLVWGGSAVPVGIDQVEYRIKRVAAAVIQPLVTHSPEITVYEEADLIRASAEMMERVFASNDPNAPRVAGEPQCKYCRAKANCAEYQAFATQSLPMVAKSLVDVPMANWDAQQCSQFLAGRALAQSWLDDAYEAIKARLMANQLELEGWSLRDGAERKHIDNPQALFDRFSLLPVGNGQENDKFEDRLAKFMSVIEIKQSELKERVNEITGHRGKKLEATMEQLFRGITHVSKNKPSIVKARKTK